MKAEIDSLQEHGTFRVLEDGEHTPEGYKGSLIIASMMSSLMEGENADQLQEAI